MGPRQAQAGPKRVIRWILGPEHVTRTRTRPSTTRRRRRRKKKKNTKKKKNKKKKKKKKKTEEEEEEGEDPEVYKNCF